MSEPTTRKPRRDRKPRAHARTTPLWQLDPSDPAWRPVGPDGKSHVPFARDVLGEERVAAFLALLAQGIAVDVAAHADEVGTTGTDIRRFRHREEAFDRACRDAIAEGKLAYQDRLRATARARATRPEGSDRLLEVELATHVPGYEHLRRDRLNVNGNIRHEFAISFDPAALDALPIEKRRELREILLALDADIIDHRPKEIGEGDGA